MSSKSRRGRVHVPRRRAFAGVTPVQPKAGRGGKKIWLTLAVLAVAAVIYAATSMRHTKPPAASATGTTPKPPPLARVAGPRIQFASTTYDFGKAQGDDQVDCLFVFTNTGTASLVLNDVSPGCGCMKAGEWTHQVEPGQTGKVPVRYDSRHYTGYFAKSVFVKCNDSNQPNVILEIKGTVWRPLEISPPNAVLNLSAETPSNATTVRIVNNLEAPMILSDLRVSTSALAVELQTNQPGKEFQLNIKTSPPWPTASQQAHISLKSSATNSPEINISTYLNVQPIISVIPFQVRLPPAPITNEFSAVVWFRNNGTNALVLSDPVINAKDVAVRVTDDDPGRQLTATMVFAKEFVMPPGTNIELRVKSNHPQFPVLTVPIVQPPPPTPVAGAAAGR